MVNVGKYIIHGSYGYYRTSINIQPFDTQVDQEYPGPADLSDCICNHLFNVMFRQIPASVCTSLLVIPLFFQNTTLAIKFSKKHLWQKKLCFKVTRYSIISIISHISLNKSWEMWLSQGSLLCRINLVLRLGFGDSVISRKSSDRSWKSPRLRPSAASLSAPSSRPETTTCRKRSFL